MEDLDYLLAVQLQEKFRSEATNSSTNKENNNVVLSKKPSLPTSPKKLNSQIVNNHKPLPSTSLLDPAWEVIDPTPDIFALFAAFNERFFWNKLCSVEIKWSPRMTSCAGVCSYQGRGGLCSVRLSEPLLKLRPRSDLINTLLHEMIHAYLFVTANNRDRDGHGPEFHKHMYRINKEAGTKITVFHSFHDEVRLYQQHWWRCDGPCQNRKPFYGFVKRAMNRAPGPYDTWWGNHQAECGGTFIKIREPDGFGEKKKKSSKAIDNTSNSKGAADIRAFFPTSSSSVPTSVPKIVNSKKTNVRGLNNLNKPIETPKLAKPSSNSKALPNVLVLNDLNKPSSSGHASNRSNGFVSGGLKNKGSSTFVISSKTKTKTEDKEPVSQLNISFFKPFESNGQVLGGRDNDRSKSKLLSLFSNQIESSKERTKNSPNKYEHSSDRKNSGQSESESLTLAKKPVKRSCKKTEHSPIKRLFVEDDGLVCLDDLEDSNYVSCPVCSSKVGKNALDLHLENCPSLQNIFSDAVESTVDDYGDISQPRSTNLVSSPILIISDDEDYSVEEMPITPVKRKIPKDNFSAESKVPCPCCSILVPNTQINQHLDDCLSQIAVQDLT